MTAPLVIYANNFSASKPDVRSKRWALRGRAGQLIGGRTARCGFHPMSKTIPLRVHNGAAHFSGVETCGSVWTCPVCASRVATRRADDVKSVIDAIEAEGGATYMMAFTLRHSRAQTAAETRAAVTGCWSKMLSRRAWKRLCAEYGITGYIRALEVTHGGNGWHPHLHTLLIGDRELSSDETAACELAIFELWESIVAKTGNGWVKRSLFKFERAENSEMAGRYVVKWGADRELTQAHSKVARGGGLSPWGLLERSMDGDRRAGALFREYAKAFHGARQLTWSGGLKARFGIDVPDDEIAAETAEEARAEVVGVVTATEYRNMHNAGVLPELLGLAEKSGAPAVMSFIARWRIEHPPAEPKDGGDDYEFAIRVYADAFGSRPGTAAQGVDVRKSRYGRAAIRRVAGDHSAAL